MRPLLVVLTGKPASGKTTLAQALSRTEALDIPLLSRDAIKSGLEETADSPRANTDPALLDRTSVVFFDTAESWLRHGVSLITDVGFSDYSTPGLRRLSPLASTVVVHCQTDVELVRRRFLQRNMPRVSETRRARIERELNSGAFDWTRWDHIPVDAPVLQVDTTDGYAPRIDAITEFVRRARAREDPHR